MIKICPYCNDEKEVNLVNEEQLIKVRGEPIKVMGHYLLCLTCGKDFDDPKDDFDILAEAYREYNKLFPDNPVRIRE